jgi:hypothetical protein
MMRSNLLRFTTDPVRIRRIERAALRYRVTIDHGRNALRVDGGAAVQTANYQRAYERNEYRAAQVRQILDAHGVSVIHSLAYRNFGLHLDKLVREYGGETLRLRAADAVLRWTCYGCGAEVLKEICRTVFNLETD